MPQPAYSKVFIAGFLFVCFVLLTACGQRCKIPEPIVITGDMADLVDKSLLTQEPCAPPCWYGITPGITTADEALVIVKDLDFIDPDTITLGDSTIRWQTVFTAFQESKDTIAGIVFDDNGIVYRIAPDFWYHLTLQELIETIGEPDGIITRPQLGFTDFSGDCAEIDLVWFDFGLEVVVNNVPLRKADSSGLIQPDMLIYGALYFPSVSDLDEFMTIHSGNTLRDYFTMWEGFEEPTN